MPSVQSSLRAPLHAPPSEGSMTNQPEPKQVCDTCHKYKPMSEVENFYLKGEWYGECSECKAKRLRKAKR